MKQAAVIALTLQSHMAGIRIVPLFLVLAAASMAQRAFEADGKVVYEDAQGNQTNLGVAFNPVLTRDGHVVMLRGRKVGYGEPFDCNNRESKNWVAIYNPKAKVERVLFDRAVPFDGGAIAFCVFYQMQLSSAGSVLYLVSPVYATSGSLAIIRLAGGAIGYVPGVNSVYVIETGPHRDDVIYQRRTWRKSAEDGLEYPGYPFIHARRDGHQITVISDEHFTIGGNDEVPLLRKYLRKIGGSITVQGERLP